MEDEFVQVNEEGIPIPMRVGHGEGDEDSMTVPKIPKSSPKKGKEEEKKELGGETSTSRHPVPTRRIAQPPKVVSAFMYPFYRFVRHMIGCANETDMKRFWNAPLLSFYDFQPHQFNSVTSAFQKFLSEIHDEEDEEEEISPRALEMNAYKLLQQVFLDECDDDKADATAQVRDLHKLMAAASASVHLGETKAREVITELAFSFVSPLVVSAIREGHNYVVLDRGPVSLYSLIVCDDHDVWSNFAAFCSYFMTLFRSDNPRGWTRKEIADRMSGIIMERVKFFRNVLIGPGDTLCINHKVAVTPNTRIRII